MRRLRVIRRWFAGQADLASQVAAALWLLGITSLFAILGWLLEIPAGDEGTFKASGLPSGVFTLLVQQWLPFSASIALLVVGVFYLSFWLTRRQEREHLLLAVTTLVWAIFNLQYVLPTPADAGTAAWQHSVVALLPIPWLNVLIYLFVAHLVPERRPRWLERLLPWYVGGYSAAVLPTWTWFSHAPLLPVGVYTVVGIASVATIFGMVQSLSRLERGVIQVACVYCIGAAASDLALRLGWLPSGWPFLIPYTGLALLSSFTFTLQRRYVAALDAEAVMQQQLSTTLAQREAELRVQMARVIELERQQAEQRERQRLMQDLHDGVGGTLATSLLLAEQGRLSQEALVCTLREAIDELRTLVDTLQPSDHTLGDLLAGLRHRLVPRIRATGVRLDWFVADEAAGLRLSTEDTLHLLRWLQEAVSNAVRHARASRIGVYLDVRGDQNGRPSLRLEVSDDGVGFDVSAPVRGRGHGLRNLAYRADAMGAQFQLESAPGRGARLSLIRAACQSDNSPIRRAS